AGRLAADRDFDGAAEAAAVMRVFVAHLIFTLLQSEIKVVMAGLSRPSRLGTHLCALPSGMRGSSVQPAHGRSRGSTHLLYSCRGSSFGLMEVMANGPVPLICPTVSTSACA